MQNNIILSICIPTYNRAEYLEETLHSIVFQKIFRETDEIEIVISDNCSEDNTKEVSERFIGIYGSKIRYYQNAVNIKDRNYEKVLSYGKGTFLKLNNDTLKHQENTLVTIIESIRQHVPNNEIIFFANGNSNSIKSYICTNLDCFINSVSFWSTWIGGFGIWKKDFDGIKNFSRYSHLQLIQTDILFRLISSDRHIYIENTKIFHLLSPKTKGGYNIYEVFVKNYLGILEEYQTNNKISRKTLFYEKSKLFKNFLIPWTLRLWKDKAQFTFDHTGALSIVLNKYWAYPLFYFGIVYLCLRIALSKIIQLLSKFKI